MIDIKEVKKYFDKNKKFVLTIGVAFLVFIFVLFLATSVIPKTLITLSRATFSDKVQVSNSYLMPEKILAKANGEDSCEVSVFLIDKNGKPVRGKNVELLGIADYTSSGVSNDSGQITFKLTSNEEKQYKINANFSGQQLPQTIVVTFRD